MVEVLPYFVHESSCIDYPVQIGAGTRIWHFCHIMTGAVIGENCVLGQNVYLASHAVLGNNVHVQNNVSIYDGVTLEDEVFCGPSAVFTNVLTPRSHLSRRDEYVATRVRRGASIGANATITCGITIGIYAMVGAGAVVTREVQPYALVCGVPARQCGWVCACGKRLEGSGTGYLCKDCGACYTESNGELHPGIA